jgi:hypothetical protein
LPRKSVRRAQLYLLVTGLVLAALLLSAYKVFWLGFPLVPEQQSEIWRVEVQIEFDASGGPAKVMLQLPQGTGNKIVVDQSFVSPGYGLTTELYSDGQRAVYSIREAQGAQTLYYRAVIHQSRAADEASREPVPVFDKPQYDGSELAAARAVVQSALQQSSDMPTLAAMRRASC